jgi:phospholipase/lecithinase/hemolysin
MAARNLAPCVGGQAMRTINTGTFVSLLLALLVGACGGGGESQPQQGNAAQQSATQDAFDAEWLQAADQVAAAGGDAALAVEALRASPAAGLGFFRRAREVVVFGDSLSDVGTYRVGLIAQVGGGKFTTNPWPVWPETLGILLRSKVTPYRVGFDGFTQVLGGNGFAMGGSRVTQWPGIGCNLDAATNTCTALLTIPVAQQITDYLGGHDDRFAGDPLVFLLAGANDIFFQLGVFQSKAILCGNDLACLGQAQGEALAAVQQAALELAGQVQRVRDKGATRVVVLNLPEISETPFGRAPETAPIKPLIAGMVQTFNGTLAAGLQGTGATLLDLHAEFQRVLANPGRYLVSEINVPACDPAKIAAITQGLEQGGSSLFCSPLTLVQKGASVTYLFADSVHPTTLGHLIIARFVLAGIWKEGLL